MIDHLLKKYQDIQDVRTASLIARGILFVFNRLRSSNETTTDAYRDQLLAVAQAIARNGSMTESGIMILLDVLEGVTFPDALNSLTDNARFAVFEYLRQTLHNSINSITSTNTRGLTISMVRSFTTV